MKTIRIKPKHDHRIRNGHRWIFSNEIETPLREFTPGENVTVSDANGYPIGIGYINPHSLISVRLLTYEKTLNENFIPERIQSAYDRRQAFYAQSGSYRLVFGESDDLPGLVIDKYEDFYVIQSLTAGMDGLLPQAIRFLQDKFRPKAIVLRQDSAIRKLENLELSSSVVFGELPSPTIVSIQGMRYEVDLLHGQKTGFFLDQKENHHHLQDFVKGKRVLDCFTHLGGWALNAARFGAKEVVGLDISEEAVASCRSNADLNQMQNVTFKKADVFDELKRLNDARDQFDVVILDPPAFAKSKSQAKEAIKGYREINRRAAKALTPGGYLFTCSCSQAVDPETFRNTVLQGIQAAGRNAILLESRTQPKDHPILLSMRETEYLKCLVIQIL